MQPIPDIFQETHKVIPITTTADVVDILTLASRTKMPIMPSIDQRPVSHNAFILDYTAFNQPYNYLPEEFLVSIQPGMTVGQLQTILAPYRQRVPLIYPTYRSWLSILAEESLSLSQTGNRALRYWVVGTQAVTGDGKSIHYGGEVVKNATGYDLNKLFIGSKHHYGLLTQAILKLEPQPEAQRTFLFHIETLEEALDILHRLQSAITRPEILSLFRVKASFGWQLLLKLSGMKAQVEEAIPHVLAQTGGLPSELQELKLSEKQFEHWQQRLDWYSLTEPENLVLRLVLPSNVMATFAEPFLKAPGLQSADILMPLKTHQLLLRWTPVHLPSIEDIQTLHALITQQNGFVEAIRVPKSWHLHPALFQSTNPTLQTWTQRLKQQFDPNGILPGGACHDTPH